MIRELSISNFRGLSRLEIHGLCRVNLLVGSNNSGKTSILEAIELLAAAGDPSVFASIAARRGERFVDSGEPRFARAVETDVCHFFHGHQLVLGTNYEIECKGEFSPVWLLARIGQPQQKTLFSDTVVAAQDAESGEESSGLTLKICTRSFPGSPDVFDESYPLTSRGGVRFDKYRRNRSEPPSFQSRFVSTSGLSPESMTVLFDEVVLTEQEELVYEALRAIAPVERIASTSELRRMSSGERGGFFLKLSGISQRIPIGSMGDGTWRMLALSLALAKSANGLLLIDEIDTGLHFTVMDKMWRLVSAAAEKLNVQIFATTHSRDCVESLAVICHKDVPSDGRVSIQRIEPERGRSVAISEAEIIAIAERGIEVR